MCLAWPPIVAGEADAHEDPPMIDRTPAAVPARRAAPLRSVLLAVERSPSVERLVSRAALLPLARDAVLVLLCVVPRARLSWTRRRLQADAHDRLEAATSNAARALGSTVRLRPITTTGGAAGEIIDCTRAFETELVVMGPRRGPALRPWTTTRVIRYGRCPVLIVRRPVPGTYRRPLVALALDAIDPDILAFVHRVLPSRRPPLTAIHACDGHPLRATRRMAKLLAASDDGASWTRQVGHGEPRLFIEAMVEERRADLVVLGTHDRSGLSRAFLGSVAADVLRHVDCDALVVPPRSLDRTT